MQGKHLRLHWSVGSAFETILLAQLHKAKCLDLTPLAEIMGAPTRSRMLPPPFPITSQRSWHFNQRALFRVIGPKKGQVSHQLVDLARRLGDPSALYDALYYRVLAFSSLVQIALADGEGCEIAI
jgi:hypothetical protein